MSTEQEQSEEKMSANSRQNSEATAAEAEQPVSRDQTEPVSVSHPNDQPDKKESVEAESADAKQSSTDIGREPVPEKDAPNQDTEQHTDTIVATQEPTTEGGAAAILSQASDTPLEPGQGGSSEPEQPIEIAEGVNSTPLEPETVDPMAEEETMKEEQPGTETSEAKDTEVSRPSTESMKDSEKKDKKDKKKDKKREKKKSRQASRGDDERKKSIPASPAATGSNLEYILLSYFQTADLESSGHVDSASFWEILQSPEMNLQLTIEEVATLSERIEQDQSGLIDYSQFCSKAVEFISSLYQDQPAVDEHWVQLTAKDGALTIAYNKQTGEMRETPTEETDFLSSTIANLFQGYDEGSKGYMTHDEFTSLLQSEEMAAFLTNEDIVQMQQYFENIPKGKASYTDFYPIGKELILRLYRARDPSDSEWCQLDSANGIVWFNKYTGETRKDPADDRTQEIAFLNQAYAEVEAVNFELEQYKQQNKELQNQLAQAAEEQETLATQLYETGHHLDEASAEIDAKNRELDEAQAIIQSKDQEIEQIMKSMGELGELQTKLTDTEYDLKTARETIAVRDRTVAARDTNISELQRTSDAITDKLKTAHGEMDARDSAISSLKHKLNFQKMEAQKYEKQVQQLEEKLSMTEQELATTKHTLEEKTAALSQARKHLKNSRERTIDLEKDSEKLSQTQDKLRSAECEIRTLKSFLTTKTAMIEKQKKELRETKAKVSELQEKDRRRAVILADVLEKTARQFQLQQTIGTSPTRQLQFDLLQTPIETRPASAPTLPQDGDETDGTALNQSSSPQVLKSYTVTKGATTSPVFAKPSSPQKRGTKMKPRGRSKTVPKLPPIQKAGLTEKQCSFVFPTQNDLRRQYWDRDRQISNHVPTNPQCTCELCRMNASIVGPSTLDKERGQTGLTGFQIEMDPKELAMTRQLKIGQRVVIRMKKSEYDLEPQQLTGIVKYVGKIDSEYIDNRVYVGIKLDEPAGYTDGLVKGKRYFTCPPKHGKIVRITNVVAVLPNKSVLYKPLKGLSKRSPYGGAEPKKTTSSASINVV